MRLAISLLLLSLAVPANSHSEAFTFNHLAFGQSPPAEMICVGGTCPGEQLPPGKVFFRKYKFPRDTNFFGNVPILTPTYDFSQDGLFRIRFEVLCAPARLEMCIEELSSTLEEQYGFRFVEERWVSAWKWYRRGVAAPGEEVLVSRDADPGKTPKAFVAIQSVALIEKLRLKANPGFPMR